MLESRAQGRALPLIHGVLENPDAGIAGRKFLHGLPSAISRAVVHHHQLADFRPGEDSTDNDVQRFFLIINRNHDA